MMLAAPLLTGSAAAASFNCDGKLTAVEHMICDDPNLSDLDNKLAAAYRQVSAQPGVKNAQKAWKRSRDQCKDAACLWDLYRGRVLALQSASSPTSGPAAKYCVFGSGKAYSMLLTREHPGAALDFALTSWGPDGSNFSVAGSAVPGQGGWNYADGLDAADRTQRCAIHFIRLPGGYGFTLQQDAGCTAMGGFGATRYLATSFPAATRMPNAPPDVDMDALNHTVCDRQ